MTEYDERQFSENYPPGIERHWWQMARNRMIEAALHEAGLAGRRLFEVGCGPGVVVDHLRRVGWACEGCDLGQPTPLLGVAAHLHLGLAASAVPDAVRQSAEVLLLCDVIEHVADAPAFLREMAASFPQARTVLVTVPARRELWSNYDEHFGHFRRYDRPLLAEHLAQGGFTQRRCRYAFQSLYGVMLVLNRLHSRAVSYQAPRRPGLHRAIAHAFAAEARLLPGWLPGSSLIALAER